MNRKRIVSIIGGANCSQEEYGIAQEIGSILAEQGIVIVCGGRGGVMEAVCRGAQESGGLTIGILPSHDPNSGNRYLNIALPTGLGQNRNFLVAQAGEVVIAVGGGYGTLSEIAIALKSGRKVVGVGSWTAVDKSQKAVKITTATTAREAATIALEMLSREN
jgi:uncharacterized protein (TIGR00725 family)